MNTDEDTLITIDLRVPHSYARSFTDAITGNDDCLMLAIERAINDRVRDEANTGELAPFSQVEADRIDDADIEALNRVADVEARNLVEYGPYA